ncbi:MAG TPA: L-rhamnose isomerase, partial [Leptolinea sp.]
MSQIPSENKIETTYELAKEQYAALGIDTDQAIKILSSVSISLQCWQGDDVVGFEDPDAKLTGGIAATGNYPGKARNAEELRADLDKVYSLLPGSHRLNLHAIYGENYGSKISRNLLQPEQFSAWVDWAKAGKHGLDFNPTVFSHPKTSSGFSLSSYDPAIRKFWVEHCISSRKIGEYFGRNLGTPCITNIWIPDGYKDTPVDRKSPRELLKQSLDLILEEPIDPRFNLDAVEPKLFGIGSESYVVGSHDFYLGYAVSKQILLTLDSGHFHPTENIADKISSVLTFLPALLLHVSRGVRWDSDHVVTLTDDLLAITQEVIRGGYLDRVHFGLDYFDASINRVAAWAIGARNLQRALLISLLEPINQLRKYEKAEDYSSRLLMLEETKGLPSSA